MPVFKATVNQADRHKTKGDWIVRGPAVPAPAPVRKRGCRFFQLPAELRNRIYEFAFSPSTAIVLRKTEDRPINKHRASTPWHAIVNPKSTRKMPVLRCDRQLGSYDRTAGKNTNWRSSLSGFPLANKQAYKEAAPFLYEQSIFAFSTFKLARSFLQTVSQPNLDSMRRIQLHHCTFAFGGSTDAKLTKDWADMSFIRLCKQIVVALPRLSSLDITVKIYEHPDMIVPAFDDPTEVITVRQIGRLSWVQALRAFGSLRSLEEVKITALDSTDDELHCWFYCSQYITVAQYDPAPGLSVERQQEQDCQKWINFRKALYRSVAEAVKRLIMGFDEASAWVDHTEKLEEYRAFCYRQLVPSAVTRADPAYKAWLQEKVRRA